MVYKLDFEIPIDWTVCELIDIGKGNNAIVDGPFGSNLKTSDYIQDRKNGVPVLTTKNLNGDYSENSVRFISQNKYLELKRSEVLSGDILVAKIGSIGKIGIYPPNRPAAIIPANLLKFTVTQDVIFNFVYQYLNSGDFQRLIKSISTATAQPAFNVTKFRKLPLPLPPLPEQRAIVAKIEQLFSELDNGIANLKTAEEKLKIYRQAVLKKAFEGELTREWREKQSDLPTAAELLEQIKEERERYYQKQLDEWREAVKAWEDGGKEGRKTGKPKKTKVLSPLIKNNLPKLPIHWKWEKLGNIAQKIQIGPFGSQLHKYDYVKNGIPIINPKHIKNNKIFPKEFITEIKAQLLSQYILHTNDIILGRRGEMGRSAYISALEDGWFCGTGSLFIRLNNDFNGYFYTLILSEQRVIRYLEENGSGTTMTNLNSEILNNLPIQLVSPQEQTQIVQEIESRLSVCDKLEESIKESLQKAEALRQSILKKAFEGRLLTEKELQACKQEPDWEPAAVLLERIKAERSVNNQK